MRNNAPGNVYISTGVCICPSVTSYDVEFSPANPAKQGSLDMPDIAVPHATLPLITLLRSVSPSSAYYIDRPVALT